MKPKQTIIFNGAGGGNGRGQDHGQGQAQRPAVIPGHPL